MRKLLFIDIAIMAVLCSCTKFNDAHFVDIVDVGAKQKTIDVDRNSGGCSFDVFASCGCVFTIESGWQWLSIDGASGQSISFATDRRVNLSYNANNSFKRMAVILVTAPGRCDTLRVRQGGDYTESIAVSPSQASSAAEGGHFKTRILTNLMEQDLKTECACTDVSNLAVVNGSLEFDLGPNETRNSRIVTVRLYVKDGWGEDVGAEFIVNQPRR